MGLLSTGQASANGTLARKLLCENHGFILQSPLKTRQMQTGRGFRLSTRLHLQSPICAWAPSDNVLTVLKYGLSSLFWLTVSGSASSAVGDYGRHSPGGRLDIASSNRDVPRPTACCIGRRCRGNRCRYGAFPAATAVASHVGTRVPSSSVRAGVKLVRIGRSETGALAGYEDDMGGVFQRQSRRHPLFGGVAIEAGCVRFRADRACDSCDLR